MPSGEIGYTILLIIFGSFNLIIYFHRIFYFIVHIISLESSILKQMRSGEMFHNGGDWAIILEIALKLKTKPMQKAYYLEFRMTEVKLS